MAMTKTDADFLNAMIAHHTAAVTMSRQYLVDTKPAERTPDVADLARNIITAQTGEIAAMRKWLTDAGRPVTGQDGGMRM